MLKASFFRGLRSFAVFKAPISCTVASTENKMRYKKNYKTASQFGAQHLPSIICDFHSLESVCFPLTVKGDCVIMLHSTQVDKLTICFTKSDKQSIHP